jgi:hypothetical protein
VPVAGGCDPVDCANALIGNASIALAVMAVAHPVIEERFIYAS